MSNPLETTNKKSNIYTKSGDHGETSLVGGTRLLKSDPRIESYGQVDQLNSWLGLCIAELEESGFGELDRQKESLQRIQRSLFVLGSHLACERERRDTLPPLGSPEVEKLEREIDEMDGQLPALKNFILPGGRRATGLLHIARTHCRQVERSMVSLNSADLPDLALPYINRLSDFLFVLARYVNLKAGEKEIIWKS